MGISADALRQLHDAVSESREYIGEATVSAVGVETLVMLDGASSATPAASSTCEVLQGDRVTVRIADGACRITGNLSRTATSQQAVNVTVAPVRKMAEDASEDANSAKDAADSAVESSRVAKERADEAWENADSASKAAEAAKSSAEEAASSASSAISEANKSAVAAVEAGKNASLAQSAAEAAEAAAKASADDAKKVSDAYENGELSPPVLRIDSSRGTVFKSNAISTVLRVRIYWNGTCIEDSAALSKAFGATAYLQWSYQRLDDETFGVIGNADPRISDGGFSLTITSDDVDTKVVFACELIAD